MRDYRPVTEDDRIGIYAMKQAGKKQKQLVHIYGRSSQHDQPRDGPQYRPA